MMKIQQNVKTNRIFINLNGIQHDNNAISQILNLNMPKCPSPYIQ